MAAVNLIGSHNYGLVALSVLIAILASYTALDLVGRVTAARGWTRAVWLLGGAGSMGTGIWSMHYIGMLAFILPIPVAYHWPTVLLSLFAAILASVIALYVGSRQKMGAFRAVAGSVLMGGGIAVSLGDKLVVGALAIAFHMRESPGHAVIQFLNTLTRASQSSVLVRIGRGCWRWMHKRHQHQQCDGRLNRRKSAIRPSGPWIPAELAAARELYEAAQEGHIYVYSQSRYIQSEELRWLGRD